MKFLEKLVGKMNDSAVQVELFNFNIKPKDGAKARKNQLVSYLCERFSVPYLNSPNTTFGNDTRNTHLKSSSKSKRKVKPRYPKIKNQSKVASGHSAMPVRSVSVEDTNANIQRNIIRRIAASEDPLNEPPLTPVADPQLTEDLADLHHQKQPHPQEKWVMRNWN